MLRAPEISAAAAWIQREYDSHMQYPLSAAIEQVLGSRFQGHWYPDEPDRGTAFRMLECSEEMGLDKQLAKAATIAGLGDQQKAALLKALGRIRLWINPGEVNVLSSKGVTRIYGEESKNPYGKLKLKIPRTKVVVMSTGGGLQIGSDESENSQSSSGPGTPRGMAAVPGVASITALDLASGSSSRTDSPVLAHTDRARSSSSLSAQAATFDWQQSQNPPGGYGVGAF